MMNRTIGCLPHSYNHTTKAREFSSSIWHVPSLGRLSPCVLLLVSQRPLSNQTSRSLRIVRRSYLLTGFHNGFAQPRIHSWLSRKRARAFSSVHTCCALQHFLQAPRSLVPFLALFAVMTLYRAPISGCGPVRERMPTPRFVPRSIMRGLGLANQPQ